jgi:23S rRNA pseudouridine2604 synthase
LKAHEQAGTRINQYIASCGICSRREADRLIDAGRVFVNGTAATAGMRIRDTDEVTVDGKLLVGAQNKVVAAYYKPVGVTCTRSDRHADRTLEEAFSFPVRLTYAGRLDRDSEGLLLMTNDGKLIDAMMKGSAGHEKEYIVRVKSRISDADLEHFRKRVRVKELDVTTRPCKVERLGDYTFRIILTQGLNRQIRRMCLTLGYRVRKLKRIRVMNIKLGSLKEGACRELTEEELRVLKKDLGLQL